MIGFSGRSLFVLKSFKFAHNLALPFFLSQLLRLNALNLTLVLKYMCFTMISTFNLIPSATGTTGQNGRKTHRFYRLIRLVAICPSFTALECKKLHYFRVLLETFINRYDWS